MRPRSRPEEKLSIPVYVLLSPVDIAVLDMKCGGKKFRGGHLRDTWRRKHRPDAVKPAAKKKRSA